MTPDGRARIGIVLATFNGVRYLEAQLASMLEQVRPFDEIVVIDDGSVDSSIETVRRVLEGCPAEVKILENRERLGPAGTFGEGIRRSTGDIIVLCDQDDRWRADKLARLETALLAGGALAAFSDGRLIDREGAPQAGTLWRMAGFAGRRRRRWERGDHLGALLQGNVVTGATMALRSSLRDLVLPIPDNAWHDQWIAILGAATGTIVALPDLLIDYRLHGHNTMGLPAHGLRARAANGLAALAPRQGDIRRLEDVRERLRDRGLGEHALPRIEEKIRHLQSRSGLPAAQYARLLPVAREVASGRYHRYASGSRSVAADIVRKPSGPPPPPE